VALQREKFLFIPHAIFIVQLKHIQEKLCDDNASYPSLKIVIIHSIYGPRGLAPSNTLAQQMVYSAAGDMKHCLKIQFNIDWIRMFCPANEASIHASFDVSFLLFTTGCCKNVHIWSITSVCLSVSA
jgi:hypothetical protein